MLDIPSKTVLFDFSSGKIICFILNHLVQIAANRSNIEQKRCIKIKEEQGH